MIKSAQISQNEIRQRVRASVLTLVVGIVVLAIKFGAYKVSGSQAIYSDALESIVNVLTAIIGVAVVFYASQPADEDHPYGHGKVEYFSAAFEGGLITFAALVVFYGAIRAHLSGHELLNLGEGLVLISVASLFNFLLGIFLKKRGDYLASPALRAAGAHMMVDFYTSLGAIAGVGLVQLTGLVWLDRLVAILLGFYMLYSGYTIVRGSLADLLDAEDLKILVRLAEIFEKHAGTGIIQIHHTKVIRSGWFHHIDAHVVVPEFWTVEKSHDRLDIFENNVIQEYEFGGEANFHLDPCKRKYCSVCDYADCPVRTSSFVKRMPVVIEHLRSKEEPSRVPPHKS